MFHFLTLMKESCYSPAELVTCIITPVPSRPAIFFLIFPTWISHGHHSRISFSFCHLLFTSRVQGRASLKRSHKTTWPSSVYPQDFIYPFLPYPTAWCATSLIQPHLPEDGSARSRRSSSVFIAVTRNTEQVILK